MNSSDVRARLREFADRWQVAVERVTETPGSLVAFGSRLDVPVVLKAVRLTSDEADFGSVASAFAGQGMVRVYEHAPGIALLEQLSPGTPLTEVVLRGDDLAATRTLAEVVAELHQASRPVEGHDTVDAWGHAFDRYALSGDCHIPLALLDEAGERYTKLCRSQGRVRLLHGDFQHYNVLADRDRGWIAIDPKGVVGELEFELGPALRNPHEMPAVYSSISAVERRVRVVAEHLKIDPARVIEWAFAQAVLSAIWTVEDEGTVSPADPALTLAETLRPLLN